ncbi:MULTISPECIES: YnbE family lipoprotein [unclassified Brenneria]|uniref:YnbE family lipoprotein n=1 Tax=unclassified Brenneria TaxID=2634434 RepID=UPI0015564FC5|nr:MULTISPECIES: YnbE family lipoprotein [unclassified Brenneria]MBJ7220937.1 YnbE family lipoprotein [Brenneria sp. L3-3C-1]MEE3642178.1 YnbE family lipoprotein [Brenneria sp. L3_3C_1]MEE3650449.1 YnbE family lipoprotein [Brenneria sp. HEZEL_4_2_4]NPD00405.1 YnbE family lipoprotein [Brenneria sp. hezel4-2-4]
MKNLYILSGTLCALSLLAGCVPRIEVGAKEPITINMNVKIDHQIHIKADQEAVQLLGQSDNAAGEEIKKSAPQGAQ